MLSPDEGSIKKALDFQKNVGGKIAIVDKRRTSATEVKHHHLIGASLEGKTAVIYDDMISTAGTTVGAAAVATRVGARVVYVCATHGVLVRARHRTAALCPHRPDRHHRHHPVDA